MNIRHLVPVGALAAASLAAAPAFAQIGIPDPSIEIVIATRGISKGLAQTDGPQLLVRAEVGLGDLFAAAYGKNVVSSGDEGTEAGLLAGARFGWAGFQLSASAAYKRLEGIGGGVDDEALEIVLGASRRLSRVTARASATWSPDELGSTEGSLFLEAGLALDLGRGTMVSANIGRRERSGGPDYTAFNLGLTQSLWRGISADLRFHDTAQSALGEVYQSRLVGSLRARF
jgi:hypothetical protein